MVYFRKNNMAWVGRVNETIRCVWGPLQTFCSEKGFVPKLMMPKGNEKISDWLKLTSIYTVTKALAINLSGKELAFKAAWEKYEDL